MQFSASKKLFYFYVAFAAIVILALALRLPKLAQRPMHTDEAVHAVKFAQLLEQHTYHYNPFEFHGPKLVYATLISAWLQGQKTFADVTEQTLRFVPVIFGTALILILLLATTIFRKRTLLFAALLTTLSPAFVFYSRYYIMEILLVFFTFASMLCGYKYLQTKKLLWAIGTGLSLGLMHATKETCILVWFAMAVAIVLTMLLSKKNVRALQDALNWRHVFIGAVAGILVSMLLFSAFLHNPRGILDSILTFKNYITRGIGGFQEHIYPWDQYFKWLLLTKCAARPLWTEVFIFILAIPGFFGIFSQRHLSDEAKPFLQFLAFYTLVLTLIYMLLPYKTPWSLLGFYHGFILIAAVGVNMLHTWARYTLSKIFLILMLAIGIAHLTWQSWQLNFKYAADDSNPYVYSHTDNDFYRLVDGIKEITSYWPENKNTFIEVVCPDSDYWPLPWYLRDYTNVAYSCEFDFNLPAGTLIVTMPTLEGDLLKKLFEIPPPGQRNMYIPFFDHGIRLRPGVEIDLYVRKDVWDEWYRRSP
ncbi:TIGR03663 family protein [candidate division KSB1 bacterium]|nr:TIGR03663 family protein [candidate division KSB1 bacterium]